jgi:hypothetical protein
MSVAVGALAAILFLYLIATVPPFRKLIIGIVLVVGAVGAAAALYGYAQNEQYMAQQEALKHVISPAQLEFKNMTLVMENPFHLQGSIRNKHPLATVDNVDLQVTIKECPTEAAASRPWTQECEIVGQGSINLYDDVPPGQARAIDTFVNLYNIPKGQHPSWHYFVTQVVAASN